MDTPCLPVSFSRLERFGYSRPDALRASTGLIRKAAWAFLIFILGASQVPAATVAGFTGGAGTLVADQFPGVAGAGWSGPWTTGSSNLASSATGCFDTSPLSPAGGARLQVVGTGQATYAYPQRIGVRRAFASTQGAAGVSLAQDHTVSWRFRLHDSAGSFNTGGDIVLFADRSDTALGTGSNQTWAIRAVGGASPTWLLAVGDGAGGSTNLDTGVSFVAGAIYDFQVTVRPGTSWASTGWDVAITGPGVSYRRSGLRFRSTTSFTSGANLQWTAEIGVANRVRTFSIDDVRVGREAPAMPRTAESFVESMGVNTHVVSTGLYNEALYGQLGLRHFRDNIKPGNSTAYGRAQALRNNYGVHMLVATDNTSYSPAQIRDFLRNPEFIAVEGLNEPDLFGPRSHVQGGTTLTDDWTQQIYPATTAYQADLYAAMNADPLTAPKPVLAPSMALPGRSLYFGTLQADALSVHCYPGTALPTGDGVDTYKLDSVRQMVLGGVSQPQIYVTETGYKTGSASGQIGATLAAKYLPRAYAEYFNRGVARTYLFEMTDIVNQYTYGLLDSSLVKKPAYLAVQNLVTLLKEATWNTSSKTWAGYAVFTPAPFDYLLDGATEVVHRTLLQKSDGTTYLLLWQEVAGSPAPAAIPVTLLLNTPVSTASTYLPGSSTGATGTYVNPTKIMLSVTDEIQLVKLTPAAAPSPADTAAITVSAFQDPAPSPSTSGGFTLTRGGSTANALTVAYGVGGDAVAGTHYTALAGSATFAAGSAVATVPVTALAPANKQGDRSLILSLADTPVSDLENGTTSGWSSGPQSAVAVDTTNVGQGARSLKWTYNDVAGVTWGNEVVYTLPVAQNWSTASKILLRFAPSSSNLGSDATKLVYFDWRNGTSSTSGGASVAQFTIGSSTAWREVSIPLGNFARDNVTAIQLSVNGSHYDTGVHVWFVDDIRVGFNSDGRFAALNWSTGTGLLDNFESGVLTNWSTQSRSTMAVESTLVAQGAKALKWTYNDNSVDVWNNALVCNFPAAQDWSAAGKLVLSLASSSTNPDEDACQWIAFDWHNAGSSVSAGAGVAKIVAGANTAYRRVEIDLSRYPRNSVTRISFYLNGNDFVTGAHTWFIDDIRIE